MRQVIRVLGKLVLIQSWLKAGFLALMSVALIGIAQADAFADRQSKYEALCSSLDRTHVDCGCVGKRLATFLHVSPNTDFERMTEASYKVLLGIPADRTGAMEAALGSDEKRLNIAAAYEPHGGHLIEYEEGCVIAGAAPTPLASFPPQDIYQRSFEACELSTGAARWCQCDTAGRADLLSPAEFEANFLSFADYDGEDGSREGLSKMRAGKMGLAPEAYDALVISASQKLAAATDDDGSLYGSNRCHALTYGEDSQSGLISNRIARTAEERAGPPVGLESIDVSRAAPRAQTGAEMLSGIAVEQQEAFDAATRQAEGVEDEARAAQNSAELKQIRDGSNLANITSVVERGCLGEDGRSPAYCACLEAEFNRKIPADMSEGGKRMTAMMLVGAGLSPVESAQIATNASQAEQMEAAMAFPEMMDIPGTCEASAR